MADKDGVTLKIPAMADSTTKWGSNVGSGKAKPSHAYPNKDTMYIQTGNAVKPLK